MTEARCVICTGDRQAHVGLLCTGHFDRLAAMLRDVEEQAAMLDARPSFQQRIGFGKGSLASERAPVRLDVLAFTHPQTRRWTRDHNPSLVTAPQPKRHGPWCILCDHDSCKDWRAGRQRDLHDDEHDAGSDRLMSILGVLSGWARVVREDRDLTSPQRITVATEVATLTFHREWLAEQPWIDEAYDEIHTLVESVKSLNGTHADRAVGSCYLPDGDGGTCTGRIWRHEAPQPVWRIKTDRCELEAVRAPAGSAYCDECRTTWEGGDLARLLLILEREKADLARPRTDDGRKMLTAQELADQLGTTVNAVRLRLSRARIKAVGSYYHPDALRKVSA